jgi:hypothetical protein
MTINDLLGAAAAFQWPIGIYFALIPLLTRLIGLAHGGTPGDQTRWRHLYSALIYLVSFPGVMACVLTGYGLLFVRQDLRNVPLLLYFIPILSMFITWWFAHRQVDLDALPGFDRLSGFMWMVFTCFFGAFLLNRLFFGVLFFGSLWGLLGVALLLFLIFRAGARKLIDS